MTALVLLAPPAHAAEIPDTAQDILEESGLDGSETGQDWE